MKNRNAEYWINRYLDIDEEDKKNEKKLLNKIFKIYEDAYEEVTKRLYAFYTQYADDNGITYQEAIKALKPHELKECSRRIRRLHDLMEQIDTSTPFGRQQKQRLQREIQLLRNRGRVTREMALIDSINEEMIKVALEIDKELGELVKKTYTREYEEILEEANVTVNPIPVKALEQSLLTPTYGDHFSDRVWNNKDKLITFIRTELRKGLVEGRDVRKTAKILEKHLGVSEYEARRLVVTENCIARTQGSLEGYRQSNVVEYVTIIACLDKRTCVDCRDADGQVIKLSDAVVGVNVPPLHPNCRCSICPYFKE